MTPVDVLVSAVKRILVRKDDLGIDNMSEKDFCDWAFSRYRSVHDAYYGWKENPNNNQKLFTMLEAFKFFVDRSEYKEIYSDKFLWQIDKQQTKKENSMGEEVKPSKMIPYDLLVVNKGTDVLRDTISWQGTVMASCQANAIVKALQMASNPDIETVAVYVRQFSQVIAAGI